MPSRRYEARPNSHVHAEVIMGVHRRRSLASVGLVALRALPVLLVGLAACQATLPNVRPFATETGNLYRANGVESEEVIARYDSSIDLATGILRRPRLDPAHAASIEAIKTRLEDGRKSFKKSSAVFDAVLGQAVVYSEQLAELAAAGANGAEAAGSLAGTINGFGSLTVAGELITGPVSSVLSKIADFATRVQARKSLREAALAAEGAVAVIDTALTEIHREQLQRLVSSLYSDADQLLLFDAGPSIMGYYREASGRRDLFYRRALLVLQLNDDGISGFCRNLETGELDEKNCISARELEALREVEDLLAALAPEAEAYQSRRDELRGWRDRRRANGRRIVRAVSTWENEHRRVVAALEDRTGASASSLKAILEGISSDD